MPINYFHDETLTVECAHKIGRRLLRYSIVVPVRAPTHPMLEFLHGDDATGPLIVASNDDQTLTFYFGDPDTAFAFKMRFA